MLDSLYLRVLSYVSPASQGNNCDSIQDHIVHELKRLWDILLDRLNPLKVTPKMCKQVPSCSRDPLPSTTAGHKKHRRSYAHCKRRRLRYLEPDEQEILSRLCCNYDPHKFSRAEWTINLKGYAPGERRPGNCSDACKHSRVVFDT
ncbi:hypothetical protein chiPu_0028382 [Chiloscyllium punctatum]|uniref:Uncharacterized protein n=1 Tax=Chiloscyllium punctatum TaxID=137246 RepID=A0A401TPF3_CHIPU|nr:hypothetical protein [Chiloscyllium punctatum]